MTLKTRMRLAVALAVAAMAVGCGAGAEDGETLDTADTLTVPEDGTVTASEATTLSIDGARVTFQSNTDDFTVRDTAADGLAAAATIRNLSTGSTSVCWNTSGAGVTVTCARDFAEGIRIGFSACVGSARTGRLACSRERIVSTANTLR